MTTGASSLRDSGAAALEKLLAGAERSRNGLEVEVDGRRLRLRNLDEVLYPRTGFTKGDLIGWYAAAAPWLLPHLHGRPLTLKRYPSGVQGRHFYQKQSPAARPAWVRTATIWSPYSGREIDYVICEDLPTLIWLANLANIELHPSLSLAAAMHRPTALVLDLDPGPPADIVSCCEVALELRALLDALRLKSFPKTSGLKGMQLYVPLNTADATYEATKPLAHELASLLARERPTTVVSRMGKASRAGKVLIDWSQNDAHKTTISVHSLRAFDTPTASTPVRFEEVEACLQAKDSRLLTFEAAAALDRLQTHGDLFTGVLSLRQPVPELEAARSCLAAF